MSCQGTWADSIIIQAVADIFNLKINIIESHPYFTEITIVESVPATQVLYQSFKIINSQHFSTSHTVSTICQLNSTLLLSTVSFPYSPISPQPVHKYSLGTYFYQTFESKRQFSRLFF